MNGGSDVDQYIPVQISRMVLAIKLVNLIFFFLKRGFCGVWKRMVKSNLTMAKSCNLNCRATE